MKIKLISQIHGFYLQLFFSLENRFSEIKCLTEETRTLNYANQRYQISNILEEKYQLFEHRSTKIRIKLVDFRIFNLNNIMNYDTYLKWNSNGFYKHNEILKLLFLIMTQKFSEFKRLILK